MKYSFMSFSTPELGLGEMLQVAEELGYDGIEPRLDAGHAHGIERETDSDTRARIKEKVDASGVELACLATSCSYANPDTVGDMIVRTHECIDLAADVGAPVIRVFGGAISTGVTRDRAVDLLVSALRSVAPHASNRGVRVCLETHDSWCDPKQVARVLEGVSDPSIGVNWDIMHPVRTGLATIDESFDILKPWIGHLHIHDGKIKGGNMDLVPIGTGDVDHRRVIKLLKTVSFCGYLSGEWIGWEPYQVHLPRELATLKAYEREV